MPFLLGFLAGVVACGIAMVPLLRLSQRRAVRRARDAERRARAAERLAELGSMSSGLAHEIKNPLSTVGLNAQLLAESLSDADLPEDEKGRLMRRLDALSREVSRLRDILSDFLQFAGRMKLDPQLRDLRRLVDELGDFYHPQCDQSNIVLRLDLPPDPVTAPIDETLLKQALLNLMINATQAMAAAAPDGEPGARATVGDLILRLEADDDEARVHVIDTGPGIAEDQLESIFHPYVSTRTGGTGLGLPTARRVAEEHGGRLVAHSRPGQGSDFVIHLPLAATDAAEPVESA